LQDQAVRELVWPSEERWGAHGAGFRLDIGLGIGLGTDSTSYRKAMLLPLKMANSSERQLKKLVWNAVTDSCGAAGNVANVHQTHVV